MHRMNSKLIEVISDPTQTSNNGKQIADVNIRKVIDNDNTMSPLLFCLALNPLGSLLNRTRKGYKLNFLPVVNHIMYMDDIKMYG